MALGASDPVNRGRDASLAKGRSRLRVVGAVFALAFLSIGMRLLDMVGWGAEEARRPALASIVSDQLTAARPPVTASRADIVDRNGMVLATNLRVPGVHADPSRLADKAGAARQLAAILPGVDAQELEHRLRTARRFAWVKHRIAPEEQQAVLELGLPGVGFRLAEHRVYPKGNLASHVTGFVNIDGVGQAGIERSQQERLSTGGSALALSLDLRLQQIVHQELSYAHRRFRSIGANALVLDIVTGELLAMVSLPDFDPNRVGAVNGIEYLNRNLGEVYELGSVFKILTIAAALDSGKIGLGDKFDATGKLKIGRHRIGDDHAKNRWLSVSEIFEYSSNIGTARMAFAAGGAPHLEDFFRRVGLYRPPEIEIAEVVKPRTPRRWAEVTVATTAFGHGIAVTPLQFVDAVAGLVRDGTRVSPTLLRRDPGDVPPRTRYVSAHTAELLRWLMWLVVEHGTGTQAKLGSYEIGGKTGTAEKPTAGSYSLDRILASFVAAFPIDDPRYVVFVSLDEPKGDAGTFGLRYGGWTAAPVVSAIIDRIGPILGVPPSRPDAADEYRARLAELHPASAKHTRQEASLALGSALR
jgi:cell division protein FtsI (penicillin-binding protein 3)